MFSLLVRRTHMYIAMFLFPWMLMYALSTLVMNHREYFIQKYGRGPAPFEKEREFTFEGTFTPDAEPKDVARQLLAAAGLEGAHGVNRRDGAIVINRNDLLSPRRITYRPDTKLVTIEKMQYRSNAMLERFHRRRGYTTGYALDTIWAATVDLVIIGMVFWVLSGLWMWWEMKVTRKLGALAIAGGVLLFAGYLLAI